MLKIYVVAVACTLIMSCQKKINFDEKLSSIKKEYHSFVAKNCDKSIRMIMLNNKLSLDSTDIIMLRFLNYKYGDSIIYIGRYSKITNIKIPSKINAYGFRMLLYRSDGVVYDMIEEITSGNDKVSNPKFLYVVIGDGEDDYEGVHFFIE